MSIGGFPRSSLVGDDIPSSSSSFVRNVRRRSRSVVASDYPSYSSLRASTARGVRRRSSRVVAADGNSRGRLLPSYLDLGDADNVCVHCGATFWYDERVLRSSRVGSLTYSHCCKHGSISLPAPLLPPAELLDLYSNAHIMQNIRAYNSVFSMTSLGAKIDDTVNSGHGPYTFKISGQVSHWIGSLCPQPLERPRFLQLYIYDTSNEVDNRLEVFRSGDSLGLKPEIVASLNQIMSRYNQYVQTFRNAVHIANEHRMEEFSVRLYENVGDGRYGLPQPGTLGGIVVANDPNASRYDIVVRSRNGYPHRISKLHPSYMPLQYPLLFPYGESGWSPRLKLRSDGDEGTRSLTVNAYYSYVFHTRRNVYSMLLHAGRLLQQFLVDAYLCIEDSRLDFVRTHQNQLRSEYLRGVNDAINRGDSEGRQIGKRIYLPATFIGGPRYMYKHYQDALALCRVFGNPQYFITFTCNARWPEIVRFMDSEGVGHSQNRPDVISRVFKMKVARFIDFLKEDQPFGSVCAYLYTIEFQKRGLPHCHTLLWVNATSKIRSPEDVDRYISAEFPDPVVDPLLYSTVTSCMLHGPCGLVNLNAPCMRSGSCRKNFPKPFCPKTFFDKDGYVHYKRGEAVLHTLQNGVQLHNGYVVPYNRRLLARFNAHINVEYCGWNMMIKYLFKYISKGVERVSFALQKDDASVHGASTSTSETVDEIKNFVDGRFICPQEATWRIFNFPIHQRFPAVQILAVHLENLQNITFPDNASLQEIVNNENFGKSTLTSWFESNCLDVGGRDLTYVEYPSKFRWDTYHKEWIPRSRDGLSSVGRLIYVHPTAGELFYLRLLLCHQKWSCSFLDVRTVNGIVYESFRLACEALGLIGDDREWLTAFIEASTWAASSELRSLFCHLLLFCEVTNPIQLWENACPKMGDDIRRTLSDATSSPGSVVSDDMVTQHVLLELEKLLNAATPRKSLNDFKLPLPSTMLLASLQNRLLLEETLYDTVRLQKEHAEMVCKLNPDQLVIYNKIRADFHLGKQTLLFVYGHGGTGKTFLWTTILTYFRSIGKVILAVVASGIASLLLPNGRTSHSRFNIPLDLSDTCMCDIKKKTQLAELLEQTTMIIWDEATMTERRCFECVDRSFRDVLGRPKKVFGGMSMLLGGDFRQTLPVKRKKTHQEIMASTLPNSYLWPYFTVYRLSHNMRLLGNAATNFTSIQTTDFATWLLNIGNGLVGTPDLDHPGFTFSVQIPHDFLIMDELGSLEHLVKFVYGSNALSDPTPEFLCNRAIVCPKNDTTDEVNNIILNMAPGAVTSYYSTDSVTPHTQQMCNLELLYPQDYLNQLTFPSLPLHNLQLKKNVPIILLRNMNQKNGLCNGTRLIVTQLLSTVIEATIITGTCIGKRVYIPRIKFVHHDPELPFVFVRKQFPCKLCYAMTINKSQGQSLQKIGVYLPCPVFGHGQLYVALSRATSPDSIKVLILDEHGNPTNTTKNIVFKDFLARVYTL